MRRGRPWRDLIPLTGRATPDLHGGPANHTLTRVRRGTVPSREGEGPFAVSLYARFLDRLPVRRIAPREDGQPLNAEATGHIAV